MPSKAKKIANPSKSETTEAKAKSEKAKQEDARYEAALNACSDADYIDNSDVHELLNKKVTREKLGRALMHYILEAINRIQKSEVANGHAEDSFPSKTYILLGDKETSKSSTKKASNKGNTAPKAKRLPKKKGQQVEEPVEVEEHVDEEHEEVKEQVKEQTKEQANETKADTTESKKQAVTQVNKNAKTWLWFVVNRFTYELVASSSKVKFANEEEFVTYALRNISKDFTSHMTRVVVGAVLRCRDQVEFMPDHELSSDLCAVLKPIFEGDKRPTLERYATQFLVSYFKLLGLYIAQQLWCTHHGVNEKMIEVSMRLIDNGNDEFLVKEGVYQDGESSMGLHTGLLHYAHEVDRVFNPPKTEEEKKELAAKRKASKEAKAAGKSNEQTNKSNASDKSSVNDKSNASDKSNKQEKKANSKATDSTDENEADDQEGDDDDQEGDQDDDDEDNDDDVEADDQEDDKTKTKNKPAEKSEKSKPAEKSADKPVEKQVKKMVPAKKSA